MEYDVKFLKKCTLLAKIESRLVQTSGFSFVDGGEVYLTPTAFKACFGNAYTPNKIYPWSPFPYEFSTWWHGTKFLCGSKEDHS